MQSFDSNCQDIFISFLKTIAWFSVIFTGRHILIELSNPPILQEAVRESRSSVIPASGPNAEAEVTKAATNIEAGQMKRNLKPLSLKIQLIWILKPIANQCLSKSQSAKLILMICQSEARPRPPEAIIPKNIRVARLLQIPLGPQSKKGLFCSEEVRQTK